jgi:hypothetical protein
MPSPSPSLRPNDMAQPSLERPLIGAVICCTSVAPELRVSELVEMIKQSKVNAVADQICRLRRPDGRRAQARPDF